MRCKKAIREYGEQDRPAGSLDRVLGIGELVCLFSCASGLLPRRASFWFSIPGCPTFTICSATDPSSFFARFRHARRPGPPPLRLEVVASSTVLWAKNPGPCSITWPSDSVRECEVVKRCTDTRAGQAKRMRCVHTEHLRDYSRVRPDVRLSISDSMGLGDDSPVAHAMMIPVPPRRCCIALACAGVRFVRSPEAVPSPPVRACDPALAADVVHAIVSTGLCARCQGAQLRAP